MQPAHLAGGAVAAAAGVWWGLRASPAVICLIAGLCQVLLSLLFSGESTEVGGPLLGRVCLAALVLYIVSLAYLGIALRRRAQLPWNALKWIYTAGAALLVAALSLISARYGLDLFLALLVAAPPILLAVFAWRLTAASPAPQAGGLAPGGPAES